jgi:hypothetical protein
MRSRYGRLYRKFVGAGFGRCRTYQVRERMGFRIENDVVEIQRARRREEQIEIFECLGQREALHFVALLFGDDVGERSIAGISAAESHEVVEELFSHSPILRIAGEVIEVIA